MLSRLVQMKPCKYSVLKCEIWSLFFGFNMNLTTTFIAIAKLIFVIAGKVIEGI